MEKFKHLKMVFLLMVIAKAQAHCPKERMYQYDDCVFTIECFQVIDFDLPEECRPTDRPVAVNMTLYDPAEIIDEETKRYLLETITTFKAIGSFKDNNFTFLEYIPRLKHIYFVNNKISIENEKPFYHLNLLETLDLSKNSLSELTYLLTFDGTENKLKNLILANNDLSVIDQHAFDELHSLVELDLSQNNLSELKTHIFKKLRNLQILNLNNNNIMKLNGALNDLKNLNHLYLRGNGLETDNVNWKELGNIIFHLQTFDVSDNEITELNPFLLRRHWIHFEVNSISKIQLSGNNIAKVPNATNSKDTEKISRGTKHNVDVMTEVDLSCNNISIVEYNAFKHVQKLISLDLSDNNINKFELNGTNLGHVQRLNLSNNELEFLNDDCFATMIQLENLDVSYNYLNKIAGDLFLNNRNLKYINFTRNNINEINYLYLNSYNSHDGNLDVSNNELTKVTLGRELLIAGLLIQSNRINDMTHVDLKEQIGLQYLKISDNKIKFINESSLQLPITLLELDLSYNEIDTIRPSAFAHLSNLVTLRLMHNRIQTIEFGTFQGLKSLRNLDLSYNEMVQFTSKMVIELKMMQFLSVKYNEIHTLDYTHWIGHKYDLYVYIEGNKLSCEWLGTALKDYYSGYSKMKPSSHLKSVTNNSIDGIPCLAEVSGRVVSGEDCMRYGMADERLLMINRKILEAIKDQTLFLQKHYWNFMRNHN